jgi:hypothetical protein
MVDNEPHAVVRLLLARMESHPEEFKVGDGPFLDRWYDSINTINAYGNETDKAALNVKLRDLRLGEAHERVMDELLNGPERRRKEEEEREYERNMTLAMQKQQTMQQQAAMQQQAQQNAYRNQYQNAAGAQGLLGRSPTTSILGKSSTLAVLDEWSTITTSTAEPTLSTSTINAIKKALKL